MFQYKNNTITRNVNNEAIVFYFNVFFHLSLLSICINIKLNYIHYKFTLSLSLLILLSLKYCLKISRISYALRDYRLKRLKFAMLCSDSKLCSAVWLWMLNKTDSFIPSLSITILCNKQTVLTIVST